MIRVLVLLLFALSPAAAIAGTRATFVDRQGFRQTILIADNGDLDVELRTGMHLIVRSGRAFIAQDRLTGPLVTVLDELVAALAAQAAAPRQPPSPQAEAAMNEAVAAMNRAAADAQAAAAAASADIPASTSEPDDAADSQSQAHLPSMAQRDGLVVNGRTGRGYYNPGDGFRGERPFAVISDDPALAPIGAAFRRGLEAEALLERAGSDNPSSLWEMDSATRAILASGTPIQYYDSKLRSVERVAIPSIALPAEPETGTALRARLADEAAARDGPPAPERVASRVFFAGGRLYLVAGNHRLLSLAAGEQSLTRHDLAEPVLDACTQGGAPVALTGAGENPQTWTLRRLQAGQWRAERSVAAEDDAPVALACTPDGTFLLTSRRFINLTPARPAALRIQGDPIHALVTAAVHVTRQAVFVGLNAGEWGGGLRRIDRRTGRVETIERNGTGDLCDGPLNTNCDPVQGLATIPWRRECIAAAIGLIHMEAHGRIAMVCPGRVEQLYAIAYHEPEDPEWARRAALGGLGSVAFFGVAAIGDNLLAVGHNGLYRLAPNGTATHIPLPRFVRIEGMLVSFALPDVVLVVTGINGRASLSGSVPIMAVRQAP